MAIEKMELVNIAGLVKDLDQTLLKCCQSECFHIELASQSSEIKNNELVALNEENPYTSTLRKLINLSSGLQINFEKIDYLTISDDVTHGVDKYLDDILLEYNNYNSKLQMLNQSISEKEQATELLKKLSGITADLQHIFSSKYVSVRMGKLPTDSLPKLEYYEDDDFFFVPLNSNNSYIWGLYFSPIASKSAVDEIFKSLYFERLQVPDFLKGTPEEAYANTTASIQKDKEEVAELTKKIEALKQKHMEKLNKVFVKLKFMNDTFELRRNVVTVNGKFYLVGFVPTNQAKHYEEFFEEIPSVSLLFGPPDYDEQIKPPTKLKNGFFSKPFSMLVEMYGLPSYNGINPTTFFAITYTILFGLMFGDMGQGAVLFIAGLIISKAMKNPAGGILSRLGISSMFFGFMYGSVFGFEELLNPIYKSIGWAGKPLEVFHETNFILLGAVAIGVTLITISILINIFLGFKQKDYEKAIFGCNGIVGLVFYLSVIIGAALTIKSGIKVFTPLYIIFLVVLPLLFMFFRVPLSHLIKHGKISFGEDDEGIGTFIVENFFELFEFLLSYVTNTMSFLRVGGFILSHAGMMLVVMTLAEGVSAGASPIIIVTGNIFVMAMEGMIVGIQVMRLEFYEIFSRFFDGDGKPFVPVRVKLNTDIE